MALKNFTEVENHKTVQELFCSAEFVRGVESELILLSALNIFLSITAFLGNTLILVALHKETSLYPPSKLLYSNLVIIDLCVRIISEPLISCDLLDFCGERKMGYLLLHNTRTTFFSHCFVFSIFINIDCNKLGQTSRLVVGTQMQTGCNFEKNTFNCDWFLDFVHRRNIY